MQELVYNKKAMKPLMDRFLINESDNTFVSVITLFEKYPSYQVWGINSYYGGVMSMYDLQCIKELLETGKDYLKKLSCPILECNTNEKQNKLQNELRGINFLKLFNKVISMFNPDQKLLLTNFFLRNESGKKITIEEAYSSCKMEKYFQTFQKFLEFYEKHQRKTNVFLKSSGGYSSIAGLIGGIVSFVEGTYDWSYESFKAYLKQEAKSLKYNTVFDKDNVIVLQILDALTSKEIGGKGQTSWCIARSDNDDFWSRYVTKPDRKQYFLLDFNKDQNSQLSHIGFTIDKNDGFTDAHSTSNYSLMGSGIDVDDDRYSITKALNCNNIPLNILLTINKPKYEWNKKSILKKLSGLECSIVYETENSLVVFFTKGEEARNIVYSNFLNSKIDRYSACGKYVVFNFDKNYDEIGSIYYLYTGTDEYGIQGVDGVYDIFGQSVTSKDFNNETKISYKDFIDNSGVDPSLLLHKYIDSEDENSAVELLNEKEDKIDINYSLRNTTPIFSAISHGMEKLFDKIVKFKGFDVNSVDGFGETLLESLIYFYCGQKSRDLIEDAAQTRGMIMSILSCENIDLNKVDINLDTAINIAAEKEMTNWLVEELVKREDVNLNIINDYDCAAVGNAIRKGNIGALEILGKRPDLVIRTEDKKLAKEQGINLDDYIKPSMKVFYSEVGTESKEYSTVSAK